MLALVSCPLAVHHQEESGSVTLQVGTYRQQQISLHASHLKVQQTQFSASSCVSS